jgi:hypothetical protein
MAFLVDAECHLRVSDYIAAAIEDEVVGNADDLDIGSTDSLPYEKGGLIYGRNSLLNCVRCLRQMLVERGGCRVCDCFQSSQMVSLVFATKPTQNYFVGTGFRFLLSVVPQEHP